MTSVLEGPGLTGPLPEGGAMACESVSQGPCLMESRSQVGEPPFMHQKGSLRKEIRVPFQGGLAVLIASSYWNMITQ